MRRADEYEGAAIAGAVNIPIHESAPSRRRGAGR
nr:hypothetical protein [Nocardioides convexus]